MSARLLPALLLGAAAGLVAERRFDARPTAATTRRSRAPRPQAPWPVVSAEEMLALEATVRDALLAAPAESTADAARRVLAEAGDPRWKVARAILGLAAGEHPWRRMKLAAKAAQQLARRAS